MAKILPNEPYVHFYLCSIYEREEVAERALAEFQTCAATDPNFEAAVYEAGYFLAKSGQFHEAIVQFKKVITLDPENACAQHNLAFAYAKSDKDAAARPEFEAACHLNASFCPPPDQR